MKIGPMTDILQFRTQINFYRFGYRRCLLKV